VLRNTQALLRTKQKRANRAMEQAYQQKHIWNLKKLFDIV